ncbi:MAG: flagellar type III secretion system pore protein FliP [Planctomycetes bacterium]|nr:flagellar type III secretion system pore protein FliP [Planctomycetota bacterium]
MKSKWRRAGVLLALALCVLVAFSTRAGAEGVSVKIPFIQRAGAEDSSSTVELMLILTALTLAPAILIMTTAFTRIVVVLSFLRRALGTQELPPNQLLIGLSLILTFMVMRTTLGEIKDQALVPYLNQQITQQEAFDKGVGSLRNFMFTHVSMTDLKLFKDLSEDPAKPGVEWKTYGDVDTLVLVPAFVTSELKRGFYMGFVLYLPFLVIDLVVATVLISMGMLVLPPVLISMPFKLLLFVLVDGWNLVILSLARSFQIVPSY